MPTENRLNLILLTPPGRGAVATLLVEGPRAWETVSRYFHPRGTRPLVAQGDPRLAFGRFGAEPGEEVVVRCRSAEAVELHCHGGYATVAMIEQILGDAGCQPLSWQDWVARQAPDAATAAAAIALAEARTERTAAILLDQYHGALRREISGIEAALQQQQSAVAQQQIEILLARVPLGRHLVEPWHVAVAGRPNVGKSSLINALVGYGRSLVHRTAGTTRDVVTARTALDGWPVELADTAGLHAGANAVERAGIELARQRLAQADLVLLVFDRSAPWTEADRALVAAWPTALLVHNKSDLPPSPDVSRPAGAAVSALDRQGLDGLIRQIVARLIPHPPPPGAGVPVNAEQRQELERLRYLSHPLPPR